MTAYERALYAEGFQPPHDPRTPEQILRHEGYPSIDELKLSPRQRLAAIVGLAVLPGVAMGIVAAKLVGWW